MADFPCDNCGARLEHGMRFCRQCGTPVDSSEATTRQFSEPVRVESATQPANSWPTSPTFAPMSVQPPIQTSPTRSMEQPGQKKPIIILVSVIVVLVATLIALAVILLNKPAEPAPTSTSSSQGQTQQPPPPPSVGVPGGMPGGPPSVGVPPPPIPPPPGAISAEIEALRYPGAQQTMNIGGDEGKVLGLKTADPFDKVVEWYKSKIPSASTMVMSKDSVILTGKDVAVVINAEDGEAQILITSGKKQMPIP